MREDIGTWAFASALGGALYGLTRLGGGWEVAAVSLAVLFVIVVFTRAQIRRRGR